MSHIVFSYVKRNKKFEEEEVYLSGTQKNLVWVRKFFFVKHAKLKRFTKFGMQERGNANFGMREKSSEKARGNAEREEEMKERGQASREGPARTRPQLCLISY